MHDYLIVVDFHAEITSEKMAMGHYLDGKATLVVGTHTHVPTSDFRILAKWHCLPKLMQECVEIIIQLLEWIKKIQLIDF